MALINAAAVILATIFAVLAVVFGIASTMSIGTSDPQERRDATVSAFWSLLTLALCAAVIVTLTGCMSAKELECLARDNTSRPCN